MRLATLSSLKLPNFSARLMASMLEEQGRDVKAALSDAGLPPSLLTEPGGEVTGLQELAFQRMFFELTRDQPPLWVELGRRYRLLPHAPECYYLMMVTAATMQEAVETGLRLSELYFTLSKASGLYSGGRLVGIRSDMTEVPQDLRRFTVLRDFASNYVVLSELWGGPFPFDRIEVPLPQSDEKYVRRCLPDVPIVYEAEAMGWHWSVKLDERRGLQSDAQLHDFYTRKCEAVIEMACKSQEPDEFFEKLDALLVVAKGQLSLCETADRLGLSIRTLQRRLNDHGVSFRDLAASARHRSACALLKETRTPISRIALDVGYGNISSFNHAFRRQAGMSPRSFRRAPKVEA